MDIYLDGSFRRIDKLKEMVVLADHGMDHELSEEAMEQHSVNTLVGSSGIKENIADMITDRKSLSTSLSLNELEFNRDDFDAFYNDFIGLNRKQRLKLNGLEEKRVDIITPGVELLRYLLQEFGIDTVRISEDALREGMVLDYIEKKRGT